MISRGGWDQLHLRETAVEESTQEARGERFWEMMFLLRLTSGEAVGRECPEDSGVTKLMESGRGEKGHQEEENLLDSKLFKGTAVFS